MRNQIVPTNNRARMIKDMLANSGGRMFSVTFIKANGEERTLTGNYGHVKGQDGRNMAAGHEKYITVILPERDAKGQPLRRNVNCETVRSIRMNGTTINFE